MRGLLSCVLNQPEGFCTRMPPSTCESPAMLMSPDTVCKPPATCAPLRLILPLTVLMAPPTSAPLFRSISPFTAMMPCTTSAPGPRVTGPLTVLAESAVECAPMSMEPLTMVAEVTLAFSSRLMEPLTAPTEPLCCPAGTWMEPLTVLAPSALAVTLPLPASMSQPLRATAASTDPATLKYRHIACSPPAAVRGPFELDHAAAGHPSTPLVACRASESYRPRRPLSTCGVGGSDIRLELNSAPAYKGPYPLGGAGRADPRVGVYRVLAAWLA